MTSRPVHLALALLLAAAGCTPAFEGRRLVGPLPPPADRPTVFVNVDVFTAVEGRGVLRAHDVVIAGGRVASLAPTGGALPEGAVVIEGEGRTLLPGFVDAHVHLGFMGAAPWAPVGEDLARNLHAHVYSGVTTVFDFGGDPTVTKALRAAVESGKTLGPRIFLTDNPFTGPGSHPVPLGKELVGFPLSLLVAYLVPQATTPDEARALVNERVAKGVDYVKITFDDMPPGTPHMSGEVLKAAIDATHAAGLKAVVHTTAPEDMVTAVEAGADLIAHGPYRASIDAEQARRIAAAKVPVVMTLAGFDALADAAGDGWAPHPMVLETTPPSLLDPVTGDAGKKLRDYDAMRALAEAATRGRPTWATSVKNLSDAGAVILVGTDSALPGTYPGGSYHHELALLAKLGVPLEPLLLGATSRAARWVKDAPEFGTVEPGKVADLVLVRGDPTVDAAALHAIEGVWLRGLRVERLPPPAGER